MHRKDYKLGIALSGGGVRGAVHLGILKVLDKNGIRPDLLAGTSAGSIVAALYAAGIEFDEFLEKLKKVKLLHILDPTLSAIYVLIFLYYYWLKRPVANWTFPRGLFKGRKIENLLEKIFEKKGFDDLHVPLSVISADINTGETVIFCSKKSIPKEKMNNTVFITDQSVAAAVRASISLPGIFVPKVIKRHTLVDGGIKNNIPVDILREQGAEKIIGVDLGVTKNRPRADTITDILMASLDIMGDELSYYIKKEYPGFYIHPDIQGVGYKDFYRISEIAKYGEKVAEKELPSIIKFLSTEKR